MAFFLSSKVRVAFFLFLLGMFPVTIELCRQLIYPYVSRINRQHCHRESCTCEFNSTSSIQNDFRLQDALAYMFTT